MMELNQHRKLRDIRFQFILSFVEDLEVFQEDTSFYSSEIPQMEPTSDCRSFGSHNQPCSQSRKISIGVMAEEPAKLRHGTRKEGETTLPNAKKVPSSGEKFVEEINKGPRVIASLRGKQPETSAHENSPWVSTRPTTKTVHFFENGTSKLQSGDSAHKISSTQEQPMKKTVQLFVNQTSILRSDNGGLEQFHSMSEGPMTKTLKFYANQTSILHSSNGVQKKFDSITYGRTRAKGGSTERVEEFAFAAAQEVRESDKGEGKKENTAGQSKDALKYKLWEILGTAPSQNEHNSNAQTLENCVKSSGLGDHLNRGKAVKPRQNSDTIETDSESPNGTLKRPVTRSLTHRKAPNTRQPKLLSKINKEGQLPTSLNYKQKCQEQNIFVFKTTGLGSLRGTGYGGSLLLSSKKNERKGSKIEPRRISFSEKCRQTSEKERPSPAKKRILQNNRTESYHNYPPKTNIECLQSENGILEEELHHSPARKTPDREESLHSPQVPKKASSQENHGFLFLKKNVTQPYSVHIPTSGTKTPTENYSPAAPSPKTNPIEASVQSPTLVNRRFMSEGFCNLRTSQTSKPASSGSEAQTESPDDSRNLRDSPIKEASHVIEEKDKEDCLSQSSKEQDVESLQEDLLINKGCQLTEKWPPEASGPEKPPFMLRPSKRFCSQEHTNFSESETTPLSPKGTISQSNGVQGPSDKNHDDGLARAVTLFAFALEKFKTRMKAETSKRSSEILLSVTEGIKLQLQNVDTQIQGDVMKFTSLGKSKRKRLETRFQEQQERLKHIQNKFKEEVNQHLQDCKSTLDDLEAYQLELKANADRQNTSHRKLLAQVEQTIETQLGDAERRITAVQRVAREKMFQLKHAITECLKDGVFS